MEELFDVGRSERVLGPLEPGCHGHVFCHALKQQEEAHAVCEGKQVSPEDADEHVYLIGLLPTGAVLEVLYLYQNLNHHVAEKVNGVNEEDAKDPANDGLVLL